MSIPKIKKIDFFIYFFIVFVNITLYFLIALIIFKKQQVRGTKKRRAADPKTNRPSGSFFV